MAINKIRKPRKLSLKGLKNKLWKTCSEYIRRRDGGVCYTCGDRKEWKLQQAGHYFHGKKYPYLYFDDRNIHCQCVRCNHYLSGNLAVYAGRLVRDYGVEIIAKLEAKKRLIKAPRSFYEDELERYRLLLLTVT